MLNNNDALIEQNNKNLSAQMNELSYALPPKSQSLSPNLNKNEHAQYSTIQEKINSIIHYGTVFLALKKRE